MAKNAKGKQKHVSAAANASAKPSKAGNPPAPFAVPGTELKPFLDLLDPKHIYITHIDQHPPPFKRQIFMVPVVMNLVISIILLVRVRQIAPYYYELIKTIWGYQTEYSIDVKAVGWNIILDELVKRTLTLLFDAFLLRFVGTWPYDFLFARPASATAWRWAVGFRDQEIGVRRSRRWDETLPRGWLNEEADGEVYKERIMPAIDRNWVKAKSSYMMMDKSWDLDFHCMIQAHELVDAGTVKLDDFQKQVLVHSEDFGWMVWPVWRLDEGAEDEGRKQIMAFKDKLTAMGKESLFFSWIELLQFETSRPGGFTEERQVHAMHEARKLFEEQGVNFDQFWKEVGGSMKNMPGMEVTS